MLPLPPLPALLNAIVRECYRRRTGVVRGFAVLLLVLSPLFAGMAQAAGEGTETVTITAPTAQDYEKWHAEASTAEALLTEGTLTVADLELLRGQLARWRETFLAAQNVNAARIATLSSQIEALGAAPAEGANEAPEIAQRRKELSEQLAADQAPGLTAVEAWRRADGLIREIDRALSQRHAAELVAHVPSPLNPANWPEAARSFFEQAEKVTLGLYQNSQEPLRRQILRSNLPMILGLLLVAGFVILRGRGMIEGWTEKLAHNSGARGRAVWAFLASLGTVVLPTAAMIAIGHALDLSGMLDPISSRVAGTLGLAGFTLFAAAWLGRRVFPKAEGEAAPLTLGPVERTKGRLYCDLVGTILALETLRLAAFPHAEQSPLSDSLFSFPTIVLLGVVLYAIGRLLRQHYALAKDDSNTKSSYDLVVWMVGGLTILVAIAAPVLAGFGYVAGASALVFPAAISLGLFGLLLVLQRFVADLWAWVTHASEAERDDALGPVLLAFALVLVSLPLFALIWGVRPAELIELANSFREGFSIGETHISPGSFFLFIVVFGLGYLTTRLLQGALRSTILPRTRLDQGGQNALVSGVGYLGTFLAGVIAITTAGIDLSGLAIVAGALSVGLGFGLQNIVSNFVSGIILLIERPVSEGDWIDVNGVQGTVSAISVRSTRIQTFDRTSVIVPNSDLLTKTVTNWTRFSLNGRVIVPVAVAHGNDARQVEKLLIEIAKEQPLVILNPMPVALLVGFSNEGMRFELRVILRDVNAGTSVLSEINYRIVERFAEAGIQLARSTSTVYGPLEKITDEGGVAVTAS